VSYWLALNHASPVTLAVAWSIIALVVSSPSLIIEWKMMQKSNSTFDFPWKNTAVYTLASIAMAIVMIASGAHDILYKSTVELVLKLLAYGLLAIAVYTPIVFVVDKEFRIMAYRSIEVVKAMRRPSTF
jgi:hypothetical protein